MKLGLIYIEHGRSTDKAQRIVDLLYRNDLLCTDEITHKSPLHSLELSIEDKMEFPPILGDDDVILVQAETNGDTRGCNFHINGAEGTTQTR